MDNFGNFLEDRMATLTAQFWDSLDRYNDGGNYNVYSKFYGYNNNRRVDYNDYINYNYWIKEFGCGF